MFEECNNVTITIKKEIISRLLSSSPSNISFIDDLNNILMIVIYFYIYNNLFLYYI